MHKSSCRVITGCLSSTSIFLLYIKALLSPLRITLTHQSFSFFEQPLRLPLTFSLTSLTNFNPCTRLKKGSWRSFSCSHNLTPNLDLPCEPRILCPPKPPWFIPSYTISLQLSSPCLLFEMTLPPFAVPQLFPTYPPYPTVTSLPEPYVWYLEGWVRVVQGYTLSVQSVSLPPPSPSRLDSGPPVIVPKPMPCFMLLSGVSLTPRHVRLNLSTYSLTLYLSCQPSLLFYPT